MLIKKGMQVRVISGAHKGEEGKVLFSSPKKQTVVVEGVNFIKKASRPSQENQKGGIIEKEAPMHVSNVMVLQGGSISRIGYKFLDDGTLVIHSNYKNFCTEERIWFLSNNLRSRSSVTKSINSLAILQTSYASEIRIIKNQLDIKQ